MSGNKSFVQFSLNGGEVSYRFESRQDQNRYLASCYKMLNFLPMPVGGAMYRPGTIFVQGTKNNTAVRLHKFKFNQEQVYGMEFGEHYLRFFEAGVHVAGADLTTQWNLDTVRTLFMFQNADVMYIATFSGLINLYKLTRLTTAPTFSLVESGYFVPGTVEDEPTGDERDMGTLTLSATTGTGVTATVSGPEPFQDADIGRSLVYLDGKATITAISGTTATIDIVSDFPSTGPFPDTDWRFVGPPAGTLDISRLRRANKVELLTSDDGAILESDLGKYILTFGGFIRIIEIVDANHARGIVVNDLKDAPENPPPTSFWSIWRPAWDTPDQGFPTSGCFHDGRLMLCRDQTVWASKVGQLEDFSLGSGDDDGIKADISDNEVDAITWIIAGQKGLEIGTHGGLYRVPQADDQPLTPSNFPFKKVNRHGSARIQPQVTADGDIIYVELGGKTIWAPQFEFVNDGFKTPDVMQYADHFTEDTFITGLELQERPKARLWVTLNDGRTLTCLYNPVEELTGWSQVSMNGCFISIISYPRPPSDFPGKDWVWLAILRTNGYFIEYFEPDFFDGSRPWKGIYTDSAVYGAAVGFTFAGLDHLEGETVEIIGGGMRYTQQVVTAGEVPIEPEIVASHFEVGLPYTGDIWTLEPPISVEAGGNFIARGWAEIGARVRKTLGLKLGINLYDAVLSEKDFVYQMLFREQRDPIAEAPALKRGRICQEPSGYDGVGRIVVRQSLPFPAEVLNIFGLLHIGDRPQCELFDEPEALPPCIPLPTPPPPQNCPDDPTINHIDTGFTQIFTGTVAFDQTNNVAYYSGVRSSGGIGNEAIVAFDMENSVILWETYGNLFKWRQPIVDPTNGDVYTLDQTAGPSAQAITQIDPADGSFIRQGATSATIKAGGLVMDHTTIFNYFSSAFSNIVSANSVSSLTELWFDNSPGTVDTGTRVSGVCVISGDLWIHVHSTTATFKNALIRFDAGTGAKTAYNLTAHPSGTFMSIAFDAVNNTIVVSGNDNITSVFDLSAHTDTLIKNTALLDTGSAINGIVDGKIWFNTATALQEYDALTGASLRTISKGDIVGGATVTSWANVFLMEDLNCLHLNHASFPSHPIGGVDSLCLPCPA